jgi:NAD(P)H dehydrogenase (quinone)
MADLLVTGASGHLGRQTIHHLLDALRIAPDRIAAASRSPGKLASFAKQGLDVRRADFDEPEALDAAFAGIERLLLVSTDALDGAGTRLRQHKAAVQAAERAGVRHLVYTSLPAADRSLVTFAPDHAGTEKAIAESTIPGWTILRNNWYFENLLHSMPGALSSGTWRSAAGAGRLPYVGRDDLALAAATALASEFAGKRTLTLGGSEAFSAGEVAALVSKATGKPLRVVDVSLEDLVRGMTETGLPEPVARTFASFDANAQAGLFEGGPEDLESLTGRRPQRLQDWIAANAGALSGA